MLQFPYYMFHRTRQGRYTMADLRLQQGIPLKSIGFTAGGPPGPFRLEIEFVETVFVRKDLDAEIPPGQIS